MFDNIIQLKKEAKDAIIIYGKLFGQKSLCMYNHGLHHVLIYTFHSKIQRLMQRLLLTASRSLTVFVHTLTGFCSSFSFTINLSTD